MSYNADTHKFSLYTEDESQIGSHSMTVSAVLSDYPEVTATSIESATIEIVEVPETCEDVEITVGTQDEVLDYFYSGSETALTFNV